MAHFLKGRSTEDLLKHRALGLNCGVWEIGCLQVFLVPFGACSCFWQCRVQLQGPWCSNNPRSPHVLHSGSKAQDRRGFQETIVMSVLMLMWSCWALMFPVTPPPLEA